MAKILRLIVSLLWASAMFALAARNAQEAPPPRAEADSYFSGTVAEISAEKLTVARTILGKPAENRTFLITPETKVEGKMHARSRVTVRYAASEQGDVALTVLVRGEAKPEKKK